MVMKKTLRVKLMLHEWVMIAYAVLTLLFMFLLWKDLVDPFEMLKTRAIALTVIAVSVGINTWHNSTFTKWLRVASVLMTLSIWYPDTYEFCRLFPYKDHIFAQWDQDWFGCQPALLFSQKLPQWWASEAFCLGYFSYFPMMWVLVTWITFCRPQYLSRIAFTLLTSFYLYYLIYMFLPVAGPQFYYQAEGVDPALGVFPDLGRYFNTHTDLYPMPGGNGPFHYCVELAQLAGERPTAAFPSSHIGVSTIMLLFALKFRMKGIFFSFLPFYLLLCGATVYIHAHYLVDAIFGFFSSFIVFWIVSKMYENLSAEGNKQQIL